MHDCPSLPRRSIFKVTVKAMNDTTGENRLVPFHAVFGILSRFSVINTKCLSQKEIMKALATIHADWNKIITKWRISPVLTRDMPPTPYRTYNTGEAVMAFLKMKKLDQTTDCNRPYR